MKTRAAIALTVMLAGCGGGSDDATGLTFTTVTGKLVAADGTPIRNATVSIPYALDQAYSAVTGADGSFSLAAKVIDFEGISPVAVSVESADYQPDTLYVNTLSPGRTGGRVDLPAKVLTARGPSDFVLPAGSRPLIHLGDDQYRGTKLQVSTSGVQTLQPLAVWTQDMKDRFRSAMVAFSARGLQTEGSLQCATYYENAVGLIATSTSGTAVEVVRPASSSADGHFTRFTYTVDVSDFVVGSQLNFLAASGRCSGGGTDQDDFEITAVVVRFIP